MIKCTIGVLLLSIGAALSGRPGLEAGGTGRTPEVTGSVVQASYRSTILGQERELIIHLPSAYDPLKRYPVLYVLDGSSQDPAGLVCYVERTPGVDHSLNAQVSGWSALTKWGAFAKR